VIHESSWSNSIFCWTCNCYRVT